ncbi:MAG: flagellar basal body L-ring protein FlgH [Geminicoccaceae bacterium]
MRPCGWRAALLALVVVPPVTGCSIAERLSDIGQAPSLSPITNPIQERGYRPVSLPMPEPEPMPAASANSLWRSGAKGFFRDQRARRVGDILTVEVSMSDNANWSNQTTRSRKADDHLGIPGFFGLQNLAVKALPEAIDGTPVDPDEFVKMDSQTRNTGRGTVNRAEEIKMNLAAVITQVLPNGNLVIRGRQEVRVNFEMREVMVAGIIRPEDITPRNTIAHEKIAELRVAYGGRGQITDVQQPRYGAQALDILLPY